MRNIFAIFKKELFSYLSSPIGYIFIIFFTLVANSMFLIFANFFDRNVADMRSYFQALPLIFLVFIPAITMRVWSEEKKMGTIELLLTMPLKEGQIILGKFFASFAFLSLTLLCTLTLPITVGYLGDPDGGVILASYIGALCLGAAYLSIGLYFSSTTDNQVVAFIISLVVIFSLTLIHYIPHLFKFMGSFSSVLQYISLSSHFENISRGILDSRDIIYYFSVVTFFLFMNYKHIEARKWR